MSRVALKVRALALAIISAAGFILGAPAATAQEDPEVAAAEAAFDAKDYARASSLYGPVCARGVGWACAEQNRALFNLGEQQRACRAPQSVAVCTDRAESNVPVRCQAGDSRQTCKGFTVHLSLHILSWTQRIVEFFKR